MAPAKRNILERLAAGEIIIGDGGFEFQMEKRGYVKAGPWTPQVNCEYPNAVKELHREFLLAGADVMQTFTFYASDDKLTNFGNVAGGYTGKEINAAACRNAREVADEGGALVAAGVCQTPSYLSGKGKEKVQEVYRKQIDVFVEHDVDFIICEYFEYVEEAEWAIEVAKTTGKPVAATISIGRWGDHSGVPAGECAVRMTKAGADIVGVNCLHGPFGSLETIKIMKESLDKAGLKPYLMCQPMGFLCPDVGRHGLIDLPEFYFALEPRTCTRWDIHKYARQAYDLGIQYIGGCCGFEAYHIRAMAEELSKERGKLPVSSDKHDMWGGGLRMHTKPWVRARSNREYWENLKPSSGRPYCASQSESDNWDIKAGDKAFIQHPEKFTNEEMKNLLASVKKSDVK